MSEECHIAIDLGAESGRVMAGWWDGKRMRLEEIHRFPNGPVWIGAGMHWNLARLWQEIETGLQKAARSFGKKIVSIGADTWALDFALLSQSKEMLGMPYHYRDARTRGMVEKACQVMPRREIFAASGLQFMEINSLCQLMSLRERSPELLEKSAHFLMIPDFIHWCLTGVVTNEFTNATTTQCYHPVERNWSSKILRAFQIPEGIFAKALPPGTAIGPLQESVAERCGLGSPQVIVPATHDTASAVIGIPTLDTGKRNWAYISSGTWSLVGIESEQPILSARALEYNFTNEGGVDGSYRVLKNVMGLWLLQRCKKSFEASGYESDYSRLIALAEKAAPFQSLIDPDAGRFLNPPDMPQAMQDFCKATGQKSPDDEGALVRCALESLALKYKLVLEFLEQLTGEKIEIIHIVGGGCRNALLNQFTADACQRPVLAGPVEATALGNLMTQARARGRIGSLQSLRDSIAASCDMEIFEPATATTGWTEAMGKFRELLRWKESRE